MSGTLEDDFLSVGAGSFARVYVMAARGFMVLKQVVDPARSEELEREYADLTAVHSDTMTDGSLLFRVPRPMGLHASYAAFAQALCHWTDKRLGPTALYVMERVPPVPFATSAVIRELVPEYSESRRMLARLYVGCADRACVSRSGPDYELDAATMQALGLPVGRLAAEMGRLLARIHHVARLDGGGVKFVLGGADDDLSEPSYFCIDFNQTRPHDGQAAVLVYAFCANAPYFPRPGMRHWDDFEAGYRRESGTRGAALADEFVRALRRHFPVQGPRA